MRVSGHSQRLAYFSYICYTIQTSLGGTATKRIHSVFCHPPTVAGGDIRLALEHLMKTILVLSILLSAQSLYPLFGELTDADLDKIRSDCQMRPKARVIEKVDGEKRDRKLRNTG